MSQIKFNVEFEGKKAEVMTGWDPPLGYYHLTIFDTDPEAEDEILWDGLGSMGFCRKLDRIEKTLADLGIEAPPGLLSLIDRREGNVVYKHDGNKWVELSRF
jgi:hypothetical protein